MDQYLSTVVVSLITGAFGIITLLIQKNSNKMVNKIDKQTVFIEKEKGVKQKLEKKKKEKEDAIHEVMMLILDTNIKILRGMTPVNGIDESVFTKAEDLKVRYECLSDEIDDINKEYELVLDMAKQFKLEPNKGTNTG